MECNSRRLKRAPWKRLLVQAALVIGLCVTIIWLLFELQDMPVCEAGSAAALFTDCERRVE